MEVGLRVVRGPDWKWGNQDDGAGHVGTVVEIGKPRSLTTPDKTVVVQWDSGSRSNYRVGYQGACDLRIFDNATIGVRHTQVKCSCCKTPRIAGMRWKCTVCFKYDLCTSCYMNGVHDLNHVFLRFEFPGCAGVEVPKRSSENTVRIQSRGIFVGASVVRGFDWDWGNQDGGEGNIGKVIDIRGWENESRRSVANVMWPSGITNVYRIGHKGKVDLKYVSDAEGGLYYRNHLPILGKSGADGIEVNNSVKDTRFKVGDRVRVVVSDEQTLKALQEGHGGWNTRMSAFIGQVGVVHRVTDRRDIRVAFENCSNRWTFNPEALVKVRFYNVGDTVRICADEARVSELQRGHGEWIVGMRATLGRVGRVVKVYNDGDLRVIVDGTIWTFNQLCVEEVENNGRTTGTLCNDAANGLNSASGLVCLGGSSSSAGNDSREIIKYDTNKLPITELDMKNCGKSGLKVAAFSGHIDVVRTLLASDADVNEHDEDDNSPIHYAVLGDQPEILELLIKAGGKVDAVNNERRSPLHLAVNNGQVECVKILLKHGANVNAVDCYGDTPLNSLIGKSESSNETSPANVLNNTNVTGNVSSAGLNRMTTNTNFVEEEIGSTSGTNNVLVIISNGSSPRDVSTITSTHANNTTISTSINPPPITTTASSSSSSSSLSSAISLNHGCLMNFLGASEESSNESTSSSSTAANEEIICLLINSPHINLDIVNKRGLNCLLQAALKGNVFATEKIINKRRILVNLRKEDGYSALHLAALNGHHDVVATLLSHGEADPNLTNNRNQTALHLAVSQNHCSIIELLISFGANPNCLDNDRNSPLHLALMKWSLGDGSVRVNSKCLEKATLISKILFSVSFLFESNICVPFSIARFLVEYGGDMEIINGDGKSGFDLLKGACKSSLERKYFEKRFECIVCNEGLVDVLFMPCEHRICCRDCCERMKKCIMCKKVIRKKVIFNRSGEVSEVLEVLFGKKEYSKDMLLDSVAKEGFLKEQGKRLGKEGLGLAGKDNFLCIEERIRYLETRIVEIEEAVNCGICLDRVRNVIFLCGHGACSHCASTLKTCHMCRKTITKKISIY